MHDPQEPATGPAPTATATQAETPQAPAQDAPNGGASGRDDAGNSGAGEEPAAPQVSDAAGGGDHGGGGGDDTPPAPPPAPPVADAEDEDDEDPRLTAARPTFTHDDAFVGALRASCAVASRDLLDEDINANNTPCRNVFLRVKKSGAMSPETAYRMMREMLPEMPEWDQRDPSAEIGVTIFVAVAAALIPIADAQQKRFEEVQRALAAEAHIGRMRGAQAARREKKAQRLAKGPEARRRYVENMQRNRAGGAQTFLEPPKGKPPSTQANVGKPAKGNKPPKGRK